MTGLNLPLEAVPLLMQKLELYKKLNDKAPEGHDKYEIREVLVECAMTDLSLLRLIPDLELMDATEEKAFEKRLRVASGFASEYS